MSIPTGRTSVRFDLVRPGKTASIDDFAREIALGLRSTPKRIPCRFFYDAVGSRIFEDICELPEYYLTRAEDEILADRSARIAALVPEGSDLVELGSGSARKTSRLIRAMLARSGRLRYVPIDISRSALEESSARLLDQHPDLRIRAIAAEYEQGLGALGDVAAPGRLVLFLGSNVGNLDRSEAAAFLRRIARRLAPSDRMVLGVDLRKSKSVLERAYDDASGVTARFNRNLLVRLNAELGANFDAESFRHVAFYLEDEGRIEMHLESPRACRVRIERLEMDLEIGAGERIHTEDSYKYSIAEIEALAGAAGLTILDAWSDREERFRVNVLGRHDRDR
jgi:dimethylhistidine N-methyltransferase